MSKVALIIIYTHRYDANIEILEEIYKDRFSNIYHLIPFYTGSKPNVIPVYENSYYFQSYISQGLKSFFSEDFAHYFFIADDLILNPAVNEKNYTEHLHLNKNTCFIPFLTSLHKVTDGYWHRVKDGYKYKINVPGVEVKNELPDYDTALQRFKKFGLELKPLRFSQIWKIPSSFYDVKKMFYRDPFFPFRFLHSKIINKKYSLRYPLIGSYSDIFVISADTIREFSHICGVFAATDLFVEVALPTAVVLTAKEIVTEQDLELQGQALWTKDDFRILEKYENQLARLLNDFPKEKLYLHPIKLSKWNKKK